MVFAVGLSGTVVLVFLFYVFFLYEALTLAFCIVPMFVFQSCIEL